MTAGSNARREQWSAPATFAVRPSSVYFAHDRVDAGHDRDGVGDEAAGAHWFDALQVVKRRTADVHAYRLPRSVAHHVAADLPAWGLDRDVGLTGGHFETLG